MKPFLFSGRLYVIVPVTSSSYSPLSDWKAYFDSKSYNYLNPSIFIQPPASAPVGFYEFQVFVQPQSGLGNSAFSSFVLLCNPWCSGEVIHQSIRKKIKILGEV